MAKLGRGEGQGFTFEGQTALAAGDIALGAGWGSSTVVIRAGSCDQNGHITITGVTGGGLAQATATITVTFKEPFPNTPTGAIITTSNDNSITTGMPIAYTLSTTALVMTYSVLPVNAKIYVIDWLIPGR